MKPAQLLIVLLAVVLVALTLLFGGFGGPGAESEANGGAAAAAAPTADLDGDAIDEPDSPLEDAGDELGQDERAAVETPTVAPSETKVTLRGRVLFPEAVAADPDLTVYALSIPCRYQDFCASLEHPGHPDDEPDAVRRRVQIRQAVLDRAAVEPDGRFEVELPGDERVGFLMVRGRFLYTTMTSPVDVEAEAEVELAPAAGAWVHGQLTSADGGPVEGARVRVFGVTSTGTRDMGGQPGTFSGLVAARAGGAFEVRAVPAIEPYQWTVVADGRSGARGMFGVLTPGEERELPVGLAGGGKVSGVVVDANGHAVPGAEVSAWLPGIAFGLDDELAQRVAVDAKGAYELTGLPIGSIKVNADHPRMLDSTMRKLEIGEDEAHTGVDLVLQPGREIAGRVRVEGGGPAAGIDVIASFDDMRVSGPNFFNALRGSRSRAVTDAEGKFVLGGLGAGPFVVDVGDERPLASGGEPVRWSARRGNVLPGGAPLELFLQPPLVITGRVFDQEGAPVEAFTVVARQEVMGEFVGATIAFVRDSFVDPEGRFVLEGLEGGTWLVHVEGDGLVSVAPVEVLLPGGGEGLELGTVRSASVTGEVLDADGERVVGATVRVDEGSVGWQVQQDPFPDDIRTTTNEQGLFVLEGLPPGTAGLVAEAVGHAPSATLTVELDPGEVLEKTSLKLTQGGTLTGEVYTGEGDEATGWLVMAFQMSNFTQEFGNTRSDGHFRMENVPAGNWMIVAMDPGGEIEVGDQGLDFSAMMGAWKMAQATITEGGSTHVVIGSVPDELIRVHGKVTLGDEPYTGALMSWVPPGGRMYEEMVNTTVGPDGSYSVDLDGGGPYIVSIQVVSGSAGQQNSIEYSVDVPSGVEDHSHDFRLPLGRISGRVIGPDREPAAGARVTLTFDGIARSNSFFGGQYCEITSQGDGTFDIEGLRPGRYRLSAGGASPFSGAVQSPFGRVTTGDLNLGEDQWMQGVELRLPRPGTVDVTVVDGMGQPLPAASVFVRDAEGRMLEPFSMVVTDGSGRCEYGGVAPGEVTVSARVGVFTCEESEPVSVPEDGRVAVQLTLEAGTVLWVVLRDEQGKPATGTVSVTDSEGREMSGMFGMADLQSLYMEGQFSPYEYRLGPLPPGRYSVEAVIGGKQESKSVTLRGEQEKRVALRAK